MRTKDEIVQDINRFQTQPTTVALVDAMKLIVLGALVEVLIDIRDNLAARDQEAHDA